MSSRLLLGAFALHLVCASWPQFGPPVLGQETAGSPAAASGSAGGATLRGRLVIPERWKSAVQPEEFRLVFSEHVEMNEPPLPDGWDQMDGAKQMEWWNGFAQSEEGKKFIAAEEQRFQNRRVIESRVEPGGEFVVYDVPAATWDMRGNVLKQLPQHECLFEVFGALPIGEDVEEVALGDMEVVATPLLKSGDACPDFRIGTGEKAVTPASLRGRHVLLLFWNAANGPSVNMLVQLREAREGLTSAGPFELVPVAVDQDQEALKARNFAEGEIDPALAIQWDDEVAGSLGIRSIPWLLLLAPDGKVAFSVREFDQALRNSGLNLKEIVLHRMTGKPIPEPPAADQPAQPDK